jgi:hypothetical protein
LKLISPDRRGGKVPFPEVCPLYPHPTFRAMDGHSIHFAEYVNRIHRATGFVVKKRQGKNGIRKAQNLKSRSPKKRTAGRKNGGESGI